MVGGVMYHADGTVESFGGRWRPWLARAESIGHGRELGEPVADWADGGSPSYIPGGNMFFGRRFLDVVGPMREDYFLYCEEVEWCLRGLQKGMRLGLAPGARVLHNQGATTGSGEAPARRPKLPIYLDERNKLLVTRDRFSGRLPVSAAASLMLIFLRYGRRAAWRQLGYALQGWSAGIAGKRGVPGWLNVG
jgi:GT2 family glycosyltransferase